MSRETSTHRIDTNVFNAIMLARIEKQLRTMNSRMARLEERGIPFDATKVYQYAQINAGETETIYEYDVKPYIAEIHYIGCSWYTDTYVAWEIDRALKERIERTIGNPSAPVSEPVRLDPPLVAKERIRFIAHNESDLNHEFGVYCDGFLYPGARYRLMPS